MVAIDIVMPQLGESVTEGTLSKWLKQTGDLVEEYEAICEVETDKVNTEVPSLYSGKLGKIFVQEGQTVAVGQLICQLETDEETSKKNESTTTHESEPVSLTKVPDTSMKTRYSPAVLRLATEHEIDLTTLTGNGTGGRITRKDVLKAIDAKKQGFVQPTSEVVSLSTQTESIQKTVVPLVEAHDQIVPVSAVRRKIAERMVTAKQEIPHAWTMMEADVSGLVALRNRHKEEFAQSGVPLTFMPFFIKATVDALREFPYVNSTWAGNEIILKKEINISVAIAADQALYVPVIHQADEKNILGLARALKQLIQKTKSGTLSVDDSKGGTFTVNNTGSFGSIASQPIINQPQVAILSFESIVKKPVVINDMIGIRDRINLCLSIDHRVLDGLMAGQFLARVKERLEAYQVGTSL